MNDVEALKRIQDIIAEQETLAHSMASLLESLVSHYDGMESALKDIENGETFSEEELQSTSKLNIIYGRKLFINTIDPAMNRDTEELHAIMNEMEQSADTIDRYQ